MEQWKAGLAAVKATIKFAKDTGRLQPNAQDAADGEEAEAEERNQLRARSPTEQPQNSKLSMNVPRPVCCRFRSA